MPYVPRNQYKTPYKWDERIDLTRDDGDLLKNGRTSHSNLRIHTHFRANNEADLSREHSVPRARNESLEKLNASNGDLNDQFDIPGKQSTLSKRSINGQKDNNDKFHEDVFQQPKRLGLTMNNSRSNSGRNTEPEDGPEAARKPELKGVADCLNERITAVEIQLVEMQKQFADFKANQQVQNETSEQRIKRQKIKRLEVAQEQRVAQIEARCQKSCDQIETDSQENAEIRMANKYLDYLASLGKAAERLKTP